jgi:hypothetical protein
MAIALGLGQYDRAGSQRCSERTRIPTSGVRDRASPTTEGRRVAVSQEASPDPHARACAGLAASPVWATAFFRLPMHGS